MPLTWSRPDANVEGHASPDVPDRSESAELILLDGVRRGNAAAFETLYRMYYPRLLRFLAQMMHRCGFADEVANDTLLVVWQRAASFGGRSKLSTWIFGIAYRKALRALSRLDEPMPEPEHEEVLDWAVSPEEILSLKDLGLQVREAMAELSPDQRAVMELCYFQDLTCTEIAAVLGCPAGTVKTRMFYARRRLRPLLDGASAPADAAIFNR